jgi:hypothetical protein
VLPGRRGKFRVKGKKGKEKRKRPEIEMAEAGIPKNT